MRSPNSRDDGSKAQDLSRKFAPPSFPDVLEELFYRALRIRLVEERVIAIYPSDRIQSPVHLSIGQEAVAVGACAALKSTDILFSNYRGHAFYLAKGGELRQLFAELYGKVTGCGRGKAGSMHLFSPEVGMLLSSAVVASTIPHAVGYALAAERRGTDQVVVSVFGDGATEEGVFHESLNIAALRKLPVIFLCENNELAIHSRLSARQSYRISELPKAYGIPVSHCEEGYDPVRVKQAFAKCVESARWTRGPQFIEIHTCRYREHVGPGEDFDSGYRSREEIKGWMTKDPLITNENLVRKYTPGILAEIEDAVRFAEESPQPGSEELMAHIL